MGIFCALAGWKASHASAIFNLGVKECEGNQTAAHVCFPHENLRYIYQLKFHHTYIRFQSHYY